MATQRGEAVPQRVVGERHILKECTGCSEHALRYPDSSDGADGSREKTPLGRHVLLEIGYQPFGMASSPPQKFGS